MKSSISKIKLLLTALVGLHFCMSAHAERVKDLRTMETTQTNHPLEYSVKADKTSDTQWVFNNHPTTKGIGKMGWLTRALLLSPIFFL